MQPMTIYKLSWSGVGGEPNRERFFRPEHLPDAAVRFSERVLELDRNPNVSAAWVHLDRLPDSIHPQGAGVLAWTKCSDERETRAGFLTDEEAVHGH